MDGLRKHGVAGTLESNPLKIGYRPLRNGSRLFSQSLRSLENDRGRLGIWSLITIGVLLLLWGGWFGFGRVNLHAISRQARIEVTGQPFVVRSPVEGAIVSSELVLGKTVQRGDLLVSLDTSVLRRQGVELDAIETGLVRRVDDLGRELQAEERALSESRRALEASQAETKALVELADSRARLAENEAQRLEQVYETGLVSELEWRRAQARAEQERASVAATREQRKTQEHEALASQRGREARIAELRTEVTRLESDTTLTRARRDTAARELERREIRAPVGGRIAEVLPVVRGGFLAPGDPVASIVPEGEMRIVAEFDAEQASGRVRPGQTGG